MYEILFRVRLAPSRMDSHAGLPAGFRLGGHMDVNVHWRGMGPLESTERSLMDIWPGAFTQGLSLTFQSFRRSLSLSCSRLAEHARTIESLRQRNHATVSAANCQRNYGFTESVKHCTAQSTQKTQTIKP